METKELNTFRNSLLVRSYDQAFVTYGSWNKYKKEQWKSLLYYGSEDLMDLALALLSSTYRRGYPIAALDLAAYTISKFRLDVPLAKIPLTGIRFNNRTNENDPAQILSLKVKFDKVSQWNLHFGAHILARCALLNADPSGYLQELVRNITPPHDIISFADRELSRILDHVCPYEEEAEKELDKRTHQQIDYRGRALKEAWDFYHTEKQPSRETKDEIEAEVLMEKEVAKGINKGKI